MTSQEGRECTLGSGSWTGAEAYEEGDELHTRATEFFSTVDWRSLASHASRLRNGVSCHIAEKYSIGHFNMVRQFVFEDGVQWVARRRLPELKLVFGRREKLDSVEIMKVEIAGLKFLKNNTSVAVPQVHGYNLDPRNSSGAAYILMDYIHGTTAAELRERMRCPDELFGTPAQDRAFKQQMARIQAQLSSFSFDSIGSLYHDEDARRFYIGPEVQTGEGPWQTTREYVDDFAQYVLDVCASDAEEEEVTASTSFALPALFTHLTFSSLSSPNLESSFRSTNRDFGAHNILVNENFEIVGVIDFDGIMAAPVEVAAQYPQLSGLQQEIPGHVETRPLVVERIKPTAPRLIEYREMVRKAEKEMESATGRPDFSGISQWMGGISTSVWQGMMEYLGHQKFVNDAWMAAYMRLLRKRYRVKEAQA